MNFHPSPEELAFQTQARAYLKDITEGWGVPRNDEEYQARARAVREGLGERSWLTLGWGPPYGEASPVKAAKLREEMAYHLVPRANDYGTDLAGPLLLGHGTREQKEVAPGPAGGRPGVVVCRVHGAPGRHRPCQHQDPGRGARRQLHPERAKGLWRMGPELGVVSPAGPDGGGFVGA